MPRRALKSYAHAQCGGSKGALYRETRQATGSYVVRIVIASAEFAPLPPHLPGYPDGQNIPTAIRMRFLRHGGIYQSDRGILKNQHPNPGWTPPPANVQTRARDRAGRTALSPIVLMSSGRLFLDRGARQQCPSPLRRRTQHISIAASRATIYHRTVNRVLTVCVSSGGQAQMLFNTAFFLF